MRNQSTSQRFNDACSKNFKSKFYICKLINYLKKSPGPRTTETPEDVTNFPEIEMITLPESIPYPEGSYRPPSIPVYAGFYPSNVYLYRGKLYDWCSCGHSWTNPFCNGQCKFVLTRNRPIKFNVSESGYYKLCNCKFSANAPFCNNTHKLVRKWILKSNKGFFHVTGYASFFAVFAYWGVIWYQ